MFSSFIVYMQNIHNLPIMFDRIGAIVTSVARFAAAPGDYKLSARQSDFQGWMICDGRSLESSEYPELFEILGTSFGGCGSTFNLPNCANKVPAAISGSHALGTETGAETHTLTIPELPSHTHTGTTAAAGSHNHGGSTGGGGDTRESESVMLGSGAVVSGSGSHAHSIATDGLHTHTFTSDATGSSVAFSVMQPTIYIGNVFIYSGRNFNAVEVLPEII